MKPIIFLAFANDQVDTTQYLRNLDAERKGIKKALSHLELSEDLEIIEEVNISLEEIFDIFQAARYQNRIVGFHYGGHADGFSLLLNVAAGNEQIEGSGIVSLLAGEAHQILLDTEKHLAVLFKSLAFLIHYKLLIIKEVKTKKNRINHIKHQHHFVYINPINEQLSEDEKEDVDFFVDYNSVLLHKSSKIPKEREYISLTPFLMDTNAFKGVVNVNLFGIAQKNQR